MPDATIENTDRVLGQLETIARNADPQNIFYRRLIESLVPILQAQSVLLATGIEGKPLILYSAGEPLNATLLEEGLSLAFPEPKEHELHSQTNSQRSNWMVTRFPKNNPSMPLALMARFDQQSSRQDLLVAKNLLDAFAEISELREVYVENARAVGLWKRASVRCQELASAQSHVQLHRGLVEALRESLDADRVSLFASNTQHSTMVACSGSASIDPNSALVQSLEKKVFELLSENQPKLSDEVSSESQAHRYSLFMPWETSGNPRAYSLFIEWSDPQAIIDRVQKASNLFPIFNQTWQSQNRWLFLPSEIRGKAHAKSASAKQSRSIPKSALILAGVAALAALAMIPCPFTIQAQAYLEPVDQRIVHASADSFIQDLLVREGQLVKPQEPLVQLRSPSLELQIEEVAGQQRALEEKKNGLRVAINQLSSNSTDLANQTRVSADLKIIEVQESQSRKKQEFLLEQKEELLVRSPIEGMVVGGDLQRELSDRPLQRGDALFRVADLQGPWQLILLVADRDGGYVQKAMEQGPIQIDWGLENSTQKGLRASLHSMTKDVDQRPAEGPCRIAKASIDNKQVDLPVIGAVAYARIPCGTRPLWYIWSRPMVEFLQKRFWFTSNLTPIPAATFIEPMP